MDLPRPALLNQLSLRLSAEGRRLIYLVQDRSSGRIFTAPRNLALSLRRMKAAQAGVKGAKETLDEEAAKEAFGFLHLVQNMRDAELLKRKPFNPVFLGIPLFNVAPFQPALKGLARALVGPWYLVGLGLLALLCLWIGMSSDWVIMGAFNGIFSFEALVTFGLIAPVLKVIHEFGHVLVATRFGVPVRKAGLYLIGLYPMPFVDCTEADMTARRGHRIAISLAGLTVDVTIGLLAFVAWHFTAGTYLHSLLGNIFVFSTLNSILFNANPLIKLDGYFAMIDIFGLRNLYSRASGVLREFRQWVSSLGRAGALPQGWGQVGMLTYSLAAFLYRLNILWVIAAALVPRHLGLGALVVGWGGYVMFAAPMLQDRPNTPADATPPSRKWVFRGGVLAALGAALAFVQLPYRVVVPVSLDLSEHYLLSVQTPGFLSTPLTSAQLEDRAKVTQLTNPAILEDLRLMKQDLEGARLAYDAVQGVHPAQAIAAQEQIDSYTARIAIMEREIGALTLTTASQALFLPDPLSGPGEFKRAGEPIGYALPTEGQAHMTGDFPERYVQKYQDALMDAELRWDGAFDPVPITALRLKAVPTLDAATGTRSYQLKLVLPQSAQAVAGKPGLLKIRFQPEPLWRHAQFFAQGLLATYRDSQLLDRADYLGQGAGDE
ncbi:zinc metalloprotease [Actibacterium pelagium]|uniref:Peptidase M50 domain-containing protein n=1 Tax=Actibacterium pelagium TaxID=2029103 RepID=A0A917EH42_9RHOB|nr:hypothetical protein [Actibacterium pelagium]GGE38917.1 hypothetical protein GCM10011517_03340 [Actibacterium pelagium]